MIKMMTTYHEQFKSQKWMSNIFYRRMVQQYPVVNAHSGRYLVSVRMHPCSRVQQRRRFVRYSAAVHSTDCWFHWRYRSQTERPANRGNQYGSWSAILGLNGRKRCANLLKKNYLHTFTRHQRRARERFLVICSETSRNCGKPVRKSVLIPSGMICLPSTLT